MATPLDKLEYVNVRIEDLQHDRPPIIVTGNEDEAGYQERMESLADEPSPWKLLCEAIRHGDENSVREESLSVSLTGPSSSPAKREAILVRRLDFLKLLLKRDNYIDEYMVAIACDQKDRDVVRTLLDFGWPINDPVYGTASLLCMAVNDAKFTQWLIDTGANVNARNTLDEPPLSIAIARGSMDVVRLLIARGTDVTHGDLLHCAAHRENQSEGAKLVEELVKRGADVNAYRFNNEVAFRWRAMSTLVTPLHMACVNRNIPVAHALLQQGADPDRKLLNAGKLLPPTPLDDALETKDDGLINLLRTYSSSSVPQNSVSKLQKAKGGPNSGGIMEGEP